MDWWSGRHTVGKVLEKKLLKEGSDCACTDTDEDIVDGDLRVVLFAVGVVEA